MSVVSLSCTGRMKRPFVRRLRYTFGVQCVMDTLSVSPVEPERKDVI
jgi:hypothetical protein